MKTADFATLEIERLGDVPRITIAHPTSRLDAVDDRLHHDSTALFASSSPPSRARAAPPRGRRPRRASSTSASDA
ncbi:MAG TPA: hypothetical protein VFD84_10050 [Candidatus Binatia bacterium]|nr:hypothetical protein [Candidatus Binatia bacterium]